MSNPQLGNNTNNLKNLCHRFELKMLNLRQFLIRNFKIIRTFFSMKKFPLLKDVSQVL